MKNNRLENILAATLRWGVSMACLIAFVGGTLYLIQQGGEPMPDYTTFSYEANHPEVYTTLTGIWQGVLSMNAMSWIQMGVIALLLTPLLRVTLSLFDFIVKKDWLYATISAIVLAIIITHSIGV